MESDDDEVEEFMRRNSMQILRNINTVLAFHLTIAVPRAIRIRNDRPLSGREYIMDILEGHPGRCHELFRMSPANFRILCEKVLEKGYLKTTEVSVEEQVGMFMQIISHATTMAKVGEDFQRSKETVHRIFHQVLRCVRHMRREYIVLPGPDAPVPDKVAEGSDFYPFKDAIGAIDGTLIDCQPPRDDDNMEKWRSRKGRFQQNVLAAVDFEGNFVYVLAGWEGAAHDNMVLQEALSRFDFVVPPNRFYVADGGYANTHNFITPYRNYRYWLTSYRRNPRYRCKEELYNHRHAQLRNVVENTFGILKKRFKILKFLRPYSFKAQAQTVVACCVIHNFIRKQTGEPVEEMPRTRRPRNPDPVTAQTIDLDATQVGTNIRTTITNTLWAARNTRRQQR